MPRLKIYLDFTFRYTPDHTKILCELSIFVTLSIFRINIILTLDVINYLTINLIIKEIRLGNKEKDFFANDQDQLPIFRTIITCNYEDYVRFLLQSVVFNLTFNSQYIAKNVIYALV